MEPCRASSLLLGHLAMAMPLQVCSGGCLLQVWDGGSGVQEPPQPHQCHCMSHVPLFSYFLFNPWKC